MDHIVECESDGGGDDATSRDHTTTPSHAMRAMHAHALGARVRLRSSPRHYDASTMRLFALLLPAGTRFPRKHARLSLGRKRAQIVASVHHSQEKQRIATASSQQY